MDTVLIEDFTPCKALCGYIRKYQVFSFKFQKDKKGCTHRSAAFSVKKITQYTYSEPLDWLFASCRKVG
jgi:hypothetical protein